MGTVDDLIERAQRGVGARNALEYVRDKLTALRDDTYRKLLNAPPERVAELRADLRAIEKLAQALLVEEAQGDLAYRTLVEAVPEESTPAPPLTVPRVGRRTRRRSSAGSTTA
jgi:hypothetical protein